MQINFEKDSQQRRRGRREKGIDKRKDQNNLLLITEYWLLITFSLTLTYPPNRHPDLNLITIFKCVENSPMCWGGYQQKGKTRF